MGRTCVVLMFCALAVAVTARYVDGPVRSRRSSDEGFAWYDCGTDPNRPFKVTSLSMTPSPIQLPGSLQMSFAGEVSRQMGMSDMALRIQRETGFGWFKTNMTVPCMFNIGSCTYPDTCTLLDRMIKENWLSISADIGTQIRDGLAASDIDTSCPLHAQRLNINNMPFQLPAIPRVLSLFAGGTYHVTARFLNPTNHNQEYGCIGMRMLVD